MIENEPLQSGYHGVKLNMYNTVRKFAVVFKICGAKALLQQTVCVLHY